MRLSEVPPGELAKLGLDPYENKARLKKIAVIVLAVHCAVIVVPFAVILFMNIFKAEEPEVEIIHATLVIPKGESLDVPPDSDPEAGSPAPTEAPAPSPEPSEPEPEAPAPSPEPSEPEPEAPAPSPEPVPEVPPPPVINSKIPPLEEVKEKPKPEEKKKPEPPKPPVKEKPKPKLRTADDIRRDRQKNPKKDSKKNKDREAAIRQQRKENQAARAAAKNNAKRQQALQNVANALNPNGKGKRGTPGKKFGTWDGKEGAVNTQAYVSYQDKLIALLKLRWKEPSSLEVGGKQLSVTLTLDIAADGTLKSKTFKPSGNKYMDQSVRELLNNLKVVPVPPRAMVQEVTLRVLD